VLVLPPLLLLLLLLGWLDDSCTAAFAVSHATSSASRQLAGSLPMLFLQYLMQDSSSDSS
jgi:hypothetical protein